VTSHNELAVISFDEQYLDLVDSHDGSYPVAVDRFSMCALLNDGTVRSNSLETEYYFKDVIAVCSNRDVDVGLTIKGNIVCHDKHTSENVDSESKYACVQSWTDIVAIDAGDTQIVGLKSDGTVVAVGSEKNGQLNVDNWKDIVAVSAGQFFTCGLKADGTVITTLPEDWRIAEDGWYAGLFVDDWNQVVAISAGDWQIVGLKADGTVLYAYADEYGLDADNDEISKWTDIVAVASGLYEVMALRSDGTLLVSGNREFDDFYNLKLW